jgi:diadenylate cyclase
VGTGFPIPGWRDLVEILIVAAVLYRVLRFLVGTRALQILLGVLLLAAVYVAAFLLRFTTITYLLGVIFTYGAFAALVVFQPELRSALARLGQARILRVFRTEPRGEAAELVTESLERLARTGTGAIVAVEREVGLDEYVDTGTPMRATLSSDLIATVFSPYSPLHDGALLVRGAEIIGAACILPLTQQALADRSLGTRHRAALGLSEETDALVFVVSEENSTISLAVGGRLHRALSPDRVRQALTGRLPGEPTVAPSLSGTR